MRTHSKRGARTAVFLVAAWVVGVAMLLAGSAGAAGPRAHAAHTLKGTVTGHLHLLKSSGSELIEEGPASGPLSGHIKARLNVGATFSGTFTLYTAHGTISGSGKAVPHGEGIYESFSGTSTINHGSGRYAHVHGHGGLFGTFDRKTYGVVLQTTGTLTY